MKFPGFRHISHTLRLLPLLAAGLLTACGNSGDPVAPVVDLDDITVSFRLVAGDPASRAVNEYGSADESHIDLNNLKILIFDNDGKLKDVLFDNGKVNDSQNTTVVPFGQGMYIVTTHLDPQSYTISSQFAIVVLANWRSEDSDTRLLADWNGYKIDATEIGSLSINDLQSMIFTLNPNVESGEQPESWIPGIDEESGEGRWIPMFGSRYVALGSYDPAKFNEGNPMPFPDVNLVRAFTKIEITNLDTGDDSPEIVNITFNGRYGKGRLMQDYNFKGSTSNVPAPTISGFDTAPVSDPLPFFKKDNTYTAYIPEMALPDAGSRRAISINLMMNNSEHQKWIYLAPYGSDGLPNLTGPYGFDWSSIKRNYIYRYEINSLAFEFIVRVNPWIFGGKVHIPLEQPD